MATKHDLIIQYIIGLEVGTSISVRKVAQELGVSEGTAYRAIKDAENREYVKTYPRAGTVRIEKKEERSIERLTFAEVKAMVDGTVLGGSKGLNKTLSKFVIGAMQENDMVKYLTSGSLLIVGNRDEAHRLALEHHCAVLITGGFECSDSIRRLADKKELPVISSTYDTFTIATMINKAISERMIKKEILLVEDIMNKQPKYLHESDNISQWRKMLEVSGYSRFPVVNSTGCITGILSPRDVPETSSGTIKEFMTTNPISVTSRTTIAYAAHIMAWEGIELLPVVDEESKLRGVITRQDVIKAIQHMKNQPQMGETLEDMILANFSSKRMDKKTRFTGKVTPMLLSHFGTASWSSMTMLMSTVAVVTLKSYKQLDIVVDTFTVYFVRPLQMEDVIDMDVETVETGRTYNKVEISIYHEKELIAKGMLAAKVIRR